MVNNLPASAGDASSVPVLERSPGGENGNPPQRSCVGRNSCMSHGQRSLQGYSLWGYKGVRHDLATEPMHLKCDLNCENFQTFSAFKNIFILLSEVLL